jgi:hypothetical protein
MAGRFSSWPARASEGEAGDSTRICGRATGDDFIVEIKPVEGFWAFSGGFDILPWPKS